eukprot:841468-Amphidinium_carterae.1
MAQLTHRYTALCFGAWVSCLYICQHSPHGALPEGEQIAVLCSTLGTSYFALCGQRLSCLDA